MPENNDVGAAAVQQLEPRAEFLTLAGIAAALSASGTLGPKVYKLLHPSEPFVAAIIDSRSDDDKYVVEIELYNYDIHSLYVESIIFDEPLTLINIINPAIFGNLPGDSTALALPCRIASGTSKKMRFILARPPEDAKRGEAKIEIARLGEKSTETKTVHFLIRHSR